MSHPLQGYRVIAELYNHDVIKGTLHKVSENILWVVQDGTGDLLDISKDIILRYFIVLDGDETIERCDSEAELVLVSPE